ncbi:MAG: excinuclease ABC subunit UvrA [Clostridiales bacterium]|jgi:excinuclease ABC subunit A|nr:excinuclease ABC subunit UvrA [Clostridiales bacterium]
MLKKINQRGSMSITSRNSIIIKGARENNLKNIDLEIPRDQFIVFTGLSGSGKTSLAFDTIYAEGQRRYVESLSSYARMFLGQMEKPDVDSIEGLSPAISIDQKTTNHNPRSTVGTVTEIYDYLRLLFARLGTPHCPHCGKEIKKQTVDQIVDQLLELQERTKIQILAPVVRGRKGEHVKLLDDARKSGYVRVRIDGSVYDLSEEIALDKNKKHTIEIVIDRLIIKDGIQKRLTESIETASQLSGGLLNVDVNEREDLVFSQNFSCPDCGYSLEEIEPRSFSFNNPSGACPTCSGLGIQLILDPDLIIPNDNLSIAQNAIHAGGWQSAGNPNSMTNALFRALAKEYGFSLNTPYRELPANIKQVIMHGTGGKKLTVEYLQDGQPRAYSYAFEGVMDNLWRKYKETSSDWSKQEYESLMTHIVCPDCHGKRLKPAILAVTIQGKNISDVTAMTIKQARDFFADLIMSETKRVIAEQILREIKARTGFLVDVGLEYLTLARSASTLSGGEAQRIRLATQIGSGLVGVVYILDEPSIGLHQRDNNKLLATLKHLKDIGNTLIVVEHDSDTMLASDYIVDIGPLAGSHGGEVIYAGHVDGIIDCERSITGQYLSGKLKIAIPAKRRSPNGKRLIVRSAAENNLKNIDVCIPLGLFTCITGVSGSGKSTLVNEIIYKRLARDLNRAKTRPGKHDDIEGIQYLNKIINIDQSPIGRTPRSNPATYTGLFDLIRDVFSQTSEAKVRGYLKGRFSFNVKGGRCEACSGDGILKIEMHFLPDVYVPCEVCHGKRYNRETLEVKFKGKSISDVLDMTIEEGLEFFESLPRLRDKLQCLNDVGLSYVKLGQSSTTLSGGEAQRVKLATELSRRSTGQTMYVLDEPTTGLHTADVDRLISILQRLAEGGNTIVVIEHNLDMIKTADYIIDLGPEGGDDGGRLIATGTPEEVADNPDSYTGQYLIKALEARNDNFRSGNKEEIGQPDCDQAI